MTQWTSRAAWIGLAVALFWLGGTPSASMSQSNSAPSNPNPAGNLQMMVAPGASGTNQVIILDPMQRSLAVYNVEGGNLQLRSVRNLGWDLRMEEFNGLPPLPSELRRVQPQ